MLCRSSRSDCSPLRRPPPGDGVGAGYRVPGDLDPSDPQGRTTNQGWRYRHSNACAARLVQRFGWYGIPAALNLNIHILFLDGVYIYGDDRPPWFQRVRALLNSTLLLVLSAIGFGMVHAMILREERYLASKHAADYEHYRQRVPRYLGLRKTSY